MKRLQFPAASEEPHYVFTKARLFLVWSNIATKSTAHICCCIFSSGSHIKWTLCKHPRILTYCIKKNRLSEIKTGITSILAVLFFCGFFLLIGFTAKGWLRAANNQDYRVSLLYHFVFVSGFVWVHFDCVLIAAVFQLQWQFEVKVKLYQRTLTRALRCFHNLCMHKWNWLI